MSSQEDLKALYPFLHGKAQEPAKLEAALLFSIAEKARDSRETNEHEILKRFSCRQQTNHGHAGLYPQRSRPKVQES